jgi:hypothetical protein
MTMMMMDKVVLVKVVVVDVDPEVKGIFGLFVTLF